MKISIFIIQIPNTLSLSLDNIVLIPLLLIFPPLMVYETGKYECLLKAHLHMNFMCVFVCVCFGAIIKLHEKV